MAAQANLLSPPQTIPPKAALALSQKAPPILSSSPTSSLPWPLSLLFSTETPSTWTIHENLFLAALRTGDDDSARKILDRLTTRFGTQNERLITLRGIYEESQAKTDKELEQVFDNYEQILRENPTNFGIRKRRVAIVKSLGRTNDAITALTVLLENSPTDAEAWAELADLYAGIGEYARAIYSLEEVLLIVPNAWSAHAQIATYYYLLSQSPEQTSPLPSLALALRHFSRALELNTSYLRGFYGLKIVAKALLPILSSSSTTTPSTSSSRRNKTDSEDSGDLPPPSLATVQKLDALATEKLAEIVRNYAAAKSGWTGYEEAEVIAARELLDREGAKIER